MTTHHMETHPEGRHRSDVVCTSAVQTGGTHRKRTIAPRHRNAVVLAGLWRALLGDRQEAS